MCAGALTASDETRNDRNSEYPDSSEGMFLWADVFPFNGMNQLLNWPHCRFG